MNKNSASESSGRQTIGGPLLWLGLGCALANGLCSQPVVDWLLRSLHLSILWHADPGHGETQASLVIMASAGFLFFLIHVLASRLYRGHADLPRWRTLILLTYVCSVSWETLVGVSSILSVFDKEPSQAMTLVLFFFSSFGIGAFLFAMKNPADGFFCAGISLLMIEQFTSDVTGIPADSAYFSGATMALIFTYVYGHAWSQRLLGLLSLAPIGLCLYRVHSDQRLIVGILLLFGAVPGSLVWVVRWTLKRWRGRKVPE